MKKRKLLILAILALSLGATACGKKDKTSETVAETAQQTESKSEETPETTEETTEEVTTEVETTEAVGKIDEIELFKSEQKEAKEITSEEQKAAVMEKITEALTTEHSSYTYSSSLIEEFIETDKTTYNAVRFMQEKTVEGKRDKTKSYMHTIDNQTYIGKQTISDIEVYLFDKGENTYSYSKKLEDKDWLGARVARDLESETVNFSWLLNNLDLTNAVLKEESLEGKDTYTLTCETSLVFALDTSEVDKNFKKVDPNNELSISTRVPVKLYIDKQSNVPVKLEISYRKALQDFYNTTYSGNAESSIIMDARKGKYEIVYSDYSKEYELDIPEKVQEKMEKNIVDETEPETAESTSEESTEAE